MLERPRRRLTFGAVLGTAALAASLLMAAPAHAAEPVELAFDFGGPASLSPDGWVGIHPGSAYSSSVGYGFTAAPSGFRDRANSDLMKKDFVSGAGYTFVADVPNGSYEVTAWFGDLEAGNRSNVDLEGTAFSAPRTSAGTIHEQFFPSVQVADGQLTLNMVSGDGRLNGLRIQSPAAAPEDLTVVAIDPALPSVKLGWTAGEGATGYTVYRAEPEGEFALIGDVATNSFTDTDVELGESYRYAVAAKRADRSSPQSTPIDVAVVDSSVAAPVTPTNVRTTDAQRNSLSVAWDDGGDAAVWKVYRSTRADIPFELVATVDEPEYVDIDVLTTRPFLYRVSAKNAGGISAPSATLSTPVTTTLVRNMEYLDRAPVAVKVKEGVYLGWRLLGLDDRALAFNVYRDGIRLTAEPITGSTNYVDAAGTESSRYEVTAIVDGGEVSVTEEFGVWADQFLDIHLDRPAGGTTPTGEAFTYSPGDMSVGDLDGDGSYEFVLAWNPSNQKDNSQPGYTGNVILDAYEFDGTKLWRMDLGPNIRAGAHYTQFQVYDLDGDGRAEIAFKTADGTIDGQGTVIGDAAADYRNSTGYILTGPEYLTVFDGHTGAALDTVEYVPGRGDVSSWGDDYGNRVDRFLAGVAYFDGEHPSLMFSRGYYTRTVLAAWDFRDGELSQRWVFDTNDWGAEYEHQGNHNLTTTDVDRDGLDEVVYGSLTIDDNGTPLYNSQLGHGDAMHVGDHVTDRPGLEIFSVFETPGSNGNTIAAMRDAETGEIIWRSEGTADTGRGSSADIDPTHPGSESWYPTSDSVVSSEGIVKTAAGEAIADEMPLASFVQWWDGDLLRELATSDYDQATRYGAATISKWNPETGTAEEIERLDGQLRSGSKAQPILQADLFGDWREESVLWLDDDSSTIRLSTTTDVTEHRIPTLMHDAQYRQAIAWQNTAYNQPPHPSFAIGQDMTEPPLANIAYINAPPGTTTKVPSAGALSNTSGWANGLHDGRYDVVMNLWRGNPGDVFRLYENGMLLESRLLDASGTSQTARMKVDGRSNGSYVYTGELLNAAGATRTSTTTVNVTAAAPGKPVVSHDNWDKNGAFVVTADLWWGTNATSYQILLDGAVVGSGNLVAATPNAQRATVSLTGVAVGSHVLKAVFVNAYGETSSAPVTVVVKG